MQCTKLKAEYLEEERHAPAELKVSSEEAPMRRIPVPLGVRWREFRVQVLPLLAFGGALVLAVLLWQKTVMPMPTPTGTPAERPPVVGKDQALDPAPENPAVSQVPRGGTNGIAKAPPERD